MGRRLPPLNGLRAFEAAGRLLSFTRAADELAVTQAAISHQIRGLEAWLQHPLFHRGKGGLVLTEAGAAYLPAVRDALDTLAQATDRLVHPDKNSRLTLSTMSSFASLWLAPRLARFQARHPDIDVALQTTDALVDFALQDVDLAIRHGRIATWPGLRSELLMTEKLFVVCSPALCRVGPPLQKPADLAQHTLLHDDYPLGWSDWCAAAGIPWLDTSRGPRFTDSSFALRAAIEGRGVCLTRSVLVSDALTTGLLVRLFDTELDGALAYRLVAPASHFQKPAVIAFRDWILGEAIRDHDNASATETDQERRGAMS